MGITLGIGGHVLEMPVVCYDIVISENRFGKLFDHCYPVNKNEAGVVLLGSESACVLIAYRVIFSKRTAL